MAVESWQTGVNGTRWDSTGELTGLIVDDNRSLLPAGVDPRQNALADIKSRKGSITSPQTRDDLTTILTDGNPESFWKVTRERRPDGTSILIDLGAVLPINRIRFLGDEETFLRAYELFVHAGDPGQLQDDRPITFTNQIHTNLEQDSPVIDVETPLQFVRFIRLVSRSTQEFTLVEAEVFGDGFAPTGGFESGIIDLGKPANFGRFELLAQTDSLTGVVLQTRTGSVPDPHIYYRKTEIFQGVEQIQEAIVPIGFSEAAETYEQLVAFDRGRVEDNVEDWSPWSAPYERLSGEMLSPGNRRYLQFRLSFFSKDVRRAATAKSFSFEYSTPTLAQALSGEISPSSVVLGEPHIFDYYIRAEFGPDNRGFDRVEVETPFRATLKAVALNGAPIAFEKLEGEDRLSVLLTENRIAASGQVLRVTFEALVTVYGTTFFGKVFDSQSGELGQHVIAGDATPASSSDRLSIHGELREELVLNLQTTPAVFTPNGDGVNDELEISYLLLRALIPVPVELTLFDLAGRSVHQLQRADKLNGPHRIAWDGRGDDGRVVPPGLYVLTLSIDTDTGSENQTRIVGVVY